MNSSVKESGFVLHHEILLPIIIMIGIFYSGNLGQAISEIETAYVIDTNTLNNSFITLGIKATQQDKQAFQDVRNDLSEQMKKFNAKYEKDEKERQIKKNTKLWVDRVIYVLLLIQTILMVRISQSSTSQNRNI